MLRVVAFSSMISASAEVSEIATLPSLRSFHMGVAEQFVVAFTPYFNYEGTLDISGTMNVQGTGLLHSATQTLSWNLKGVDASCENPPLDVENSCGVHIHQGTSCYDDAGPHYWNQTLTPEDPWLVVRYHAKSSFRMGLYLAKARGVQVNTGLTNYDVLGHTMVVHDATGVRVACGRIVPRSLDVSAFAPYTGYKGSLMVSGEMDVHGDGVADSAAQDLKWFLKGVDPACNRAPPEGVANACGIHIHEGMSCYADAGGHYWNKSTYHEDPWAPVVYKTWRSPFGSFTYDGNELVVTGLDNSVVNGHTMIIHDVTGARVACGIIAPKREIANEFVPYYNYPGDLRVSGMVLVNSKGVLGDASQVLHWMFRGVDPACKTVPSGVKNACGVHIHQGMDCTSDALGHYYNETSVSEDPWLAITYKARRSFGTHYAVEFNAPVVTGLTNFDVLGHTIIVHDSEGARIACGILNVAS